MKKFLSWKKIAVLGVAVFSFLSFDSVFAAWEPAPDGDGVRTSCSAAGTTTYQLICDNGSWGGASWRVFKSGSSGSLIWGGTGSRNQLVGLSSSEFDAKKARAESVCEYYLAIGWDRKGGSLGGFLNGSHKMVSGSPIAYNSTNAVNATEILQNGPGAYVGRRVAEQGAQQLFRLWAGLGADASSYNSAGWFCLEPNPEEEEEEEIIIEDKNCEDFTPASYTSSTSTSGTSSVVSKVKNTTIVEDYKDETWAKPTDKIDWLHCYFPGAQKVASTQATGIGVIPPGTGNHGAHGGGITANGYDSLSSLYSSYWTNYFEVRSTNLRNMSPNKWTFGPGMSDIQSKKDLYAVQYGWSNNKAGKTLIEQSRTGFPITAKVEEDTNHATWDDPNNCVSFDDINGNGVWDAGEQCRHFAQIGHSNPYIKGSASGNSATDDAKVKVPYNFYNVAEAYLQNVPYVYAGETVSITKAMAYTLTRANLLTKGTYATQVDNAQVKLLVFLDGGGGGGEKSNPCDGFDRCTEIAGASVTLNPGGVHGLGQPEGTTVYSDNLLARAGQSIFNVFDAPAGRYFCVAAAVYPSSSLNDDMMDSRGSGMWYVSSPDCRVIAKKPSMQVWGNGLYTAGKIILSNAEKRVVAGGLNDYNKGATDRIVFGSWVEQNVIANGKVNIASGASDGNAGSTQRTKNGLPGSYEGTNTDICIRSPLTMPNKPSGASAEWCVAGNNPGGSADSMQKPNDKAALIAKFIASDGGNFNSIKNVTNIATAYIPKGETRVYSGESDITISGNITYADGYVNLTDIPKVIIYAKGSIIIGCGVTQIDAVLISDKYVVTCNSSGDVNSRDRSNRLQINGSVITNRLYATRTYGAASGSNSGVAAEVINYDTSLYLWGASRADVNNSGKLDTVYQTELAPRL